MRPKDKRLSTVATAALLLATLLLAAKLSPGATHTAVSGLTPLEEKVRHELILLPYYNVFDNLAFRVDGTEVTLTGQATRPTLKSDAQRVVARIEGVERVNNRIEVLPVSHFDDRIRLAVYRAVYGHSVMLQHAMQPVAPIRIIVKNGDVTLEGVVANEMAKNVAVLQTNGVPGVFAVTSNLRVERN